MFRALGLEGARFMYRELQDVKPRPREISHISDPHVPALVLLPYKV